MKHELVCNNDKNYVYSNEGAFVLVTNVGKRAYAPNFSYVLVALQEFNNIRNLVAKCIKEGTERRTATGKEVRDIEDSNYAVSVITLTKGSLVNVKIKNGELADLSINWLMDIEGKTAFKGDKKFVWFSPSGVTTFNYGFKRIQAKVANQTLNASTRQWETVFEEPSHLTIATDPTPETFEIAAKGLRVLNSILAFAKEKLGIVDTFNNGTNDILNNVPFDLDIPV